MAAMDCLVLPSHGEPFGRVLVEAMLLGRPAIATDQGGPPEIVDAGRSGFLVPVGDPQALAVAMGRMARNRDGARRMGHAGQQRAAEMFSVERNAHATCKVYQTLLSRRSPATGLEATDGVAGCRDTATHPEEEEGSNGGRSR
jgi:glycosyltransferase involved in cell wall biosynthesis